MLNLTNLITAFSALLGASDFFNKSVGNPPLVFKMWMIIVIAVSFALLVVLSAILIAVSVKEKKIRALDENDTDNSDDDNSQATVNDTVANDNGESSASQDENADHVDEVPENEVVADTVADESSNADAVADEANDSNANADEAVSDEPAQTQDNVEPHTESDAESSEEVAVDVIENNENNEPVSDDSDVVNINTEDTDKEATKDTMEKQIKDETNAKVVLGKLNYYLTESGWYFSLDANNGQQLFVSYSYTTQDGAMKGFETFAKAVLEGAFVVSEDKNGRFRYILNKKYQGPNYKTRVQCENAISSVKKFSQNYKVNVIESTPETEAAFAEYLENLKKAKDIDMDEIAKEEANTPKSGAFEIEEVDGGYRFYLYANNRQILYTSNIYASPVSARNGIDAFKKAVYGGVVVIEKDKFANYRYILRNSTTVTYAGESYDTEASAKKSFESVKRFVKSATIVPFKKKVDGEDAE